MENVAGSKPITKVLQILQQRFTKIFQNKFYNTQKWAKYFENISPAKAFFLNLFWSFLISFQINLLLDQHWKSHFYLYLNIQFS